MTQSEKNMIPTARPQKKWDDKAVDLRVVVMDPRALAKIGNTGNIFWQKKRHLLFFLNNKLVTLLCNVNAIILKNDEIF